MGYWQVTRRKVRGKKRPGKNTHKNTMGGKPKVTKMKGFNKI